MDTIISYKKSKNRKWIILIIILFLALVLAAAGFLYYYNLNSYIFEEPAIYYVNGVEHYIDSGDKAVCVSDSKVKIERAAAPDIDDTELGIFFTNRPALLSVTPLAYYSSNQNEKIRASQIHPLTQISVEYENVSFEKGFGHLSEQGDFLFDGNDSYIVLRSCELHVGDMTMSLSPLSYVVCGYDGYVMYCDHNTNSFEFKIFEDGENNQVRIIFDDGIEVQCNYDRLMKGEESYMLFSAITMLSEAF